MASGVEMLGQMSETEALAGPVQGGNMVVKPNEIPVGGAAMLAKAMRGQANKGVGGIYELPSQEPKTPEFMQMAQQNVDIQESQQQNRYPNNFADDEGGILMLPRNLRTAPGVPQTSLAYITDEEKAILGLLKPGTPHKGPEDVPSYDSMDYTPSTSKPKGATQSSFDAGGSNAYDNVSVGQGNWNFGGTSGSGNQQGDSGTGQGTQSYNDYYDKYEASVGTPDEVGVTTDDFSGGSNMGSTVAANVAQQIKEEKKQEEQQKIANKVKKANETNDKTLFEEAKNDATKMGYDLKNIVTSFLPDLFGFGDDKKKDKDKKEKGSFIDKLFSGGAFGTIMDKISKPTEESFMDNNYKAIMKDKYFDNEGNIKPGMEDDYKRFSNEYSSMLESSGALNPDGSQKLDTMKDVLMSGVVGKDTNLQRRLNPTEYFKNNPPKTGQDFKDMAQAQAEGKLAFTKGNTLAIQQGRELLAQDRGGNQNNRPRFMEQTQEEVIDTPDGVVDEESQTMKYTSPRTGDTETSVPLQRRFRTDPTQKVAQYRTTPRTEADILKYATEGTTGEGIGLEPFSEYQRRRRKALGLEELGLFN